VSYRVVLLPGDGIGPETVAAAVEVLHAAADSFGFALDLEEHPFGGAAIDAVGSPFPEDTRRACLAADAVLKGAVGGPRWDRGEVRPEQGMLAIRRLLGVYANLRPVRTRPTIPSPLRPEVAEGVDLVIVRELVGGLYFGDSGRDGDRAWDTCAYGADEIRRVVRRAFDLAGRRRGRVTSVDKANVLESSRLWREVTEEVAADFPAVELEHQLVDSMTMRLVERPSELDVIVTENLFGDILSDLAAAVTGGIGLAPSASLADDGPGLFEAVHGSAPDIAGGGRANPIATILSAALLLDAVGEHAAAAAVSEAAEAVIGVGPHTPDLGGTATTAQVSTAVAARVSAHLPLPTEVR
jgi:3-isopropylmalate dehydrogenase